MVEVKVERQRVLIYDARCLDEVDEQWYCANHPLVEQLNVLPKYKRNDYADVLFVSPRDEDAKYMLEYEPILVIADRASIELGVADWFFFNPNPAKEMTLESFFEDPVVEKPLFVINDNKPLKEGDIPKRHFGNFNFANDQCVRCDSESLTQALHRLFPYY